MTSSDERFVLLRLNSTAESGTRKQRTSASHCNDSDISKITRYKSYKSSGDLLLEKLNKRSLDIEVVKTFSGWYTVIEGSAAPASPNTALHRVSILYTFVILCFISSQFKSFLGSHVHGKSITESSD